MDKQENKKNNILLYEALSPVLVLICFLAYNIFFADGVLFGDYSNQFILLISAVVACALGLKNNTSLSFIFKGVWHNIKSVATPILILFLVGALAGTWLLSGVIPAMVFYGLKVLNPSIFLPATVIISAIISIATGSSWTTSATVGIAFVGIGTALGISSGMIAGAVISGAYFGDKMSPLSDTTNLAPAMAGTDLFTHIKYMSLTTVPTLVATLLFFSVLSFFIETTGDTDLAYLLNVIETTFQIKPVLFLVPLAVVALILFKVKPLISLSAGVVLAQIFSLVFQSEVMEAFEMSQLELLMQAVFSDVQITTSNDALNELFSSSGMLGMLWTILLILSAMVFGGAMEAIGALSIMTKTLLKLTTSVFGLFFSTVGSCLGLNIIASDQYLAIVIPGKMFKQAFENKNLAPENLSRTLEDSGTVTSVLIPWNTCGAYQSSVLGVSVSEYFGYAVFNYLSPITTLIFAAFQIKIKQRISN
ncbi:Na+/H+ antiporter NhaC family protein [Flavicella marina]|uniref:Na+/H+ antiporter NhaC family protein n=1 Tax=Flavicella marina TaxID=1475951 RepID=UPI0012648682|nr:Na+/H+ antiporter NhaC family protein [Flavicella marina]